MKKFAPALAVAILAVSSQQAVANDRYEYPYVGVSGGVAELDDFCKDLNDNTIPSCDDDATFYRIFSGARLLKHFGSEVGYTHTRWFGTDEAKIRPQALDVTGNFYFPLGDNVDIYAKAGGFLWRTKIREGLAEGSEEGIDFKTGIGARIGFGKTVSIRADFDWIPEFGNSSIKGTTDLYFVSAGLQFGF